MSRLRATIKQQQARTHKAKIMTDTLSAAAPVVVLTQGPEEALEVASFEVAATGLVGRV